MVVVVLLVQFGEGDVWFGLHVSREQENHLFLLLEEQEEIRLVHTVQR